ncbi:MAG: hypothetical protein ACOYT8_06825 [Candidatus Dependentiae bacterium]
MKRVLIALLFINIQFFAMQLDQGSFSQIYPDQRIQETVIIDSDNDNSIEEIFTRKNQELNIVNENTNTPRGYRNSKEIIQLNKKIVALKNSQVAGIRQPFTSWFGIINYIQDVQENNKFMCPFCNKNFSQAPSAASCFLLHFNQNIFTCEQCASKHDTFRSYQKHSDNCSKTTKIISPVYEIIDIDDDFAKNILNQKIAAINCCGINLGNWTTALNHIASQHKKRAKAYICNVCRTCYETSEKALECFLKHGDSTIFTCSFCNVDCATHQNFLSHSCNNLDQQQPLGQIEPVTPVYYSNNYQTNNTNVINNANYPYQEPEPNYNLNSSYYNYGNSPYYQTPQSYQFYTNENESFINENQVPYTPMQQPMTPLTALLYANVQTPNSDQFNKTPLDYSSQHTNIIAPNSNNYLSSSPPENLYNNQNSLTASYPNLATNSPQVIHRDHQKSMMSVFKLPRAIVNIEDKDQVVILENFEFNKKLPINDNVEILKKLIAQRIIKKLYSCCGIDNLTWEQLRKHTRVAHRDKVDKNKVICPMCEVVTSSNSWGYDHIAWHTHSNLFNCPIKDDAKNNSRDNRELLISHFKSCFMKKNKKNKTNSEKYVCIFCNNNYRSEYFLTCHLEKCSKGLKPLEMTEEGSNPLNLSDLGVPVIDNISINNTDKNIYESEEYFNNDRYLVNNTNQSSSDAMQSIELEGFVFNPKDTIDNNLNVLSKLVATRLKSNYYSCCELQNLDWERFCQHQKEKHLIKEKGKKSVACKVCNKSFRHVRDGCQHIANHQHPKLFSCPVCAAEKKYTEFPYEDNLYKHFKKCFVTKYKPIAYENTDSEFSINNSSLRNAELPEVNNTNQIQQASPEIDNWIDQSVDEYHSTIQFGNHYSSLTM